MDRETKQIETPVGKQKVVIKTYLTGRERREINAPFLSHAEISADAVAGATPSIKGIKGSIIAEVQNITFNLIVVEIDGNKENIADRILDMREEDFNYIVSEIDNITKDGDFEKKRSK